MILIGPQVLLCFVSTNQAMLFLLKQVMKVVSPHLSSFVLLNVGEPLPLLPHKVIDQQQ